MKNKYFRENNERGRCWCWNKIE